MNKRRCLILLLAGIAAVLTLLAAPLEAVQPPGLGFDAWSFRLVSLINPLILVSLFVPLGCWLASKVGLDAPLTRAMIEGGPVTEIAARQFRPALLVGAASAVVLLLYRSVSTPWFHGTLAGTFNMPLVTRLGFGGVGEELITRWGLMTLFAWVLVKLRFGQAAFVIAAALAAGLFAAGHLPMLYLLVPEVTAAMLLAVLLGNATAGFLFGLLYWKRGLESAIMAHALAHLFAWSAAQLF